MEFEKLNAFLFFGFSFGLHCCCDGGEISNTEDVYQKPTSNPCKHHPESFPILIYNEDYCVCPSYFECQGCGLGCKNYESHDDIMGRGPPIRCVQGFYATCATGECRCTPPVMSISGTTSSSLSSSLSTSNVFNVYHNTSCVQIKHTTTQRRKAAMHADGSDMNGKTSTLNINSAAQSGTYNPIDNEWPQRQQLENFDNSTRFIFTLSNGHAATKYIGREENWKEWLYPHKLDPEIMVKFENFASSLGVRQIQMHRNHCELGLYYLRTLWWPRLSGQLKQRQTMPRTVFDSGHLFSLLTQAFVDSLGKENIGIVRLRRNRIDLAYSKAVSTAKQGLYSQEDERVLSPCSAACVWCLCPLDAETTCVPLGNKWAMFTPFQRFLWEVDELECQWQMLLKHHPGLSYVEVDWQDKLSPSNLQTIARFIGMIDMEDVLAFAQENTTPPQRQQQQRRQTDGDGDGDGDGKEGGEAQSKINVSNIAGYNHHVTNHNEKNLTLLKIQDEDYRKRLGITSCNDFYCKLW